MKKLLYILLISLSIASCKKDTSDTAKDLTIFYVNDVHGQLDNFSKIKQIIDEERAETNVIVTCAGDIFSGNPVTDIYTPKGYPMIDVMNIIGYDVMTVGNHEFDYGDAVFQDRKEQSSFPWLCANVNTDNSVITTLPAYHSITVDDLKITFLGLIETNGKPDDIIPSTHPWKLQNLSFERAEDIVSDYANLKEQENADLYIALTHLGIYEETSDRFDDYKLARQFPYFDMIIGGHTNQLLDTVINNIPVLMANKYLNYLGLTRLSIKNKSIESIHSELIDLNEYTEYDVDLKTKIDNYNNSMPFLDDVIGYSYLIHGYSTGCFYTDALRAYMNVDIAIQNTGGVRAGLDQGDITKREIYAISPFNNGTVIFSMSVAEIKNFLIGVESGNYFSGIQIAQVGSDIEIRDLEGNIIPDETILTVGINDYIPAVNDTYFPSSGTVQTLTAAETLIAYLETINNQVNYPVCNCYFKYQ